MDASQNLSNAPTSCCVPVGMQRTLVHRCVSSAASAARLDLQEAHKLLARFPGGSVDVVKNEQTGIATVCLNRPDKKNAISGKATAELFSEMMAFVIGAVMPNRF
jgi:hypothetical protein